MWRSRGLDDTGTTLAREERQLQQEGRAQAVGVGVVEGEAVLDDLVDRRPSRSGGRPRSARGRGGARGSRRRGAPRRSPRPAGGRRGGRGRPTASVWPRRSSTPPGRARNGNTWPGRWKSVGRRVGIEHRGSCVARSAAPIPLPAVTWSIDTRERRCRCRRGPTAPSARRRARRGARRRTACTRDRAPNAT